MILLKKRAHLVLKRPPLMVRVLCVDVPQQRPCIGRRHREGAIPTLPCKPRQRRSLRLQPPRGRRLHLADKLGHIPIGMNPDRQVHMVGYTAHAQAIALRPTHHGRQIRTKIGTDSVTQQRATALRAENDVHQIERQRLRHHPTIGRAFSPRLSHERPRPCA